MKVFHDAFAANSQDQIKGEKLWTKMVPGHVCVFKNKNPLPPRKYEYKFLLDNPSQDIFVGTNLILIRK